MARKFFVGCVLLVAASGCSKPAPAPVAAAAPRPVSYSYHFVEHRWSKTTGAEPPIRLISESEGFCCLVGVGGGFVGGGESVSVDLNPDGYWYLSGKSLQNNTWARVMEVSVNPNGQTDAAPPTPAAK